MPGYLQTGQTHCYDVAGNRVPCAGSGQDAAYQRGVAAPKPRFITIADTVADRLTQLLWTRDASPAEFPASWEEARAFVAHMNKQQTAGFQDWRLPSRPELRSLLSHQTRRPALPEGHPFVNVFPSWYWTSTTAAMAPDHAWYVSMDGARMFYGGKDQSFMVWPVRGPALGPALIGPGRCAAQAPPGAADGAARFQTEKDAIVDRWTALRWRRCADLTGMAVSWDQALQAVDALRRASQHPWRLPNINELESVVDCRNHSPALPRGHRWTHLREAYWSSTTSVYEPDWAWALYLDKGAVGVGQKAGPHFHVWAVCDL